MDEDRLAASRAGMNGYITKPIDPGKLLQTLEGFCSGRSVSGTGVKDVDTKINFMPELDGVDVGGALRRLGGNVQLYQRLLRKFAESQKGAAAEIDAAVRQGRVEDAVRRAHTVKGVAANLGIERVQRAAANLEKVIKSGVMEKVSTTELAALLSEVVGCIEELPQNGMRSESDKSGVESACVSSDGDELLMFSSKLEKMLRDNDMDAVDTVEAARELIGDERARELLVLIDGYDFDGALEKLKRLVGKDA
jgi:HPt (histidine-containing phosphotransfer) domain-containing protein